MDYLKAAASYLDRSNISSSYTNVPNPSSQTGISSASSVSSSAAVAAASSIINHNVQSIINSTGLNTNSNSATNHTTNSNNPHLNSTLNWSPPIRIGLWNVHRATHNSTHKLVSIWTTEKKLSASPSSSFSSIPALVNAANSWSGGSGGSGNPRLDKMIEILKKEVSSLSRLRHPCILEVVEPLEETRTSLIFATEPITGCLKDAIERSDQSSSSNYYHNNHHPNHSHLRMELDEVETQKGILQLAKGLQFLHDSAKLVHGNLTPEAIIINAKGDWKISGFGLSTYLKQPDGQDSKWVFPEYDHRLSDSIQRNFDYIAPEYCLDEQLSTSNDMYSLGCILHSIHTRSGPPFQNHHSLDRMRSNVENLGVLRAAWSRVPDDVQEVLSQLVTRTPMTRLTASNFLKSRYFSSNLLVSTLAFLDRDTFNSKQHEEHVQFMKGLLRVLPQFSQKVVKQKILPSLLEECRKHVLLPFLLPNICFIAQQMDNEEFRSDLLPQLKPLFTIKDPPQNIMILLDNLPLFQSKATPQVFREDVMPLVYVALESDVPALQEKALKVIPGLGETLDYTHVKQVLFPQVTAVFSKTTLLSVKVNTLICFHSMVKILDKFTLTEKLVPLLARIKTKEPAVMIATLAVHEEMGKKVELQAIATLILPQLWAMSIGPLLNIDQFNRFMNAIEQLSNRVKQEHTRHLTEAKRLEESTARSQPSRHHSSSGSSQVFNEAADFESLVRGPSKAISSSIHANSVNTAPTSPSTNNAWGFEFSAPTGSVPMSARHSLTTSAFKPLDPTIGMQIVRPHSTTNTQSEPVSLGSQPPKNTSGSDPEPQFVGLPALVPQPSSLNHLLAATPKWNVIPPSSSSSTMAPLSHSNNQKKGPAPATNVMANLADFDPFA